MYEVDLLADEELSTAKTGAKKPSAVVKLEEPDSLPIARASSSAALGQPLMGSPSPASGSGPPGSAPAALSRSALAQSLLASVSGGMPLSSFLGSPSPASRRLTASIDPQDANILRARVMRLKTASDEGDSIGDDEAAKALDNMKQLVTAMNDEDASVSQLREIITQLAAMFGNETSSVSSFELLKSGLVDGLLECATTNGKGQSTGYNVDPGRLSFCTDLSTFYPRSLLCRPSTCPV